MDDVGVYPESMQENWRKSPSGDFVSRQWLLTEYDKRHKGPPGGAREMIEEAPAEDVRPVVRGEWKTAWLDHEAFGERPKVLYCSACNQVATIRTPFCPNCGADMRGKEAGHDGRM